MEAGIYLVVVLLTIIIIKYAKVFWSNNKKRLPPGPGFALPFLGNLLQLGSKPHLTFQKWRSLYGPLFSFKMGTTNAVVVSDAKLLKQLFSQEATTDRLRNPIMDFHGDQQGLATSDGRTWAEQRAFGVKTLQALSKGGTLESIVLEEGTRLVRFFQERVDAPLEMNGKFGGAILNSIWALVSGENHDWVENPELPHLKIINEFADAGNHTVETGLLFAPWIRHIFPDLSGFTRFLKASSNFKKLAADTVAKHLGLNDISKTHDYVGQYLEHAEGVTDPHSSFYKDVGMKNLSVTVSDFMIAGVDTISTTLECALLYLSHHPEIQAELQTELDSVIGSRLPSQSDKLPYTEAVILEVLRKSNVVALGLPHQAKEDFEFQGYTIPRGTILISDIFGIHMKPQVWSEPTAFRPERFLNEDKSKVVRHESLVPFSLGKRMCIGEAMAKSTLFLVVACLMQRFTVEPVDPNVNLDDMIPGFVFKPKPFKVIFKLRK